MIQCVNSTNCISGGALITNWDAYSGFGSPYVTQPGAVPVLSKPFTGFIDEVYIYNCSLTNGEVREVANTCADGGKFDNFFIVLQIITACY